MFSHLTNVVRPVALLRAAAIDRLHQLSPTETWYLNKRLQLNLNTGQSSVSLTHSVCL